MKTSTVWASALVGSVLVFGSLFTNIASAQSDIAEAVLDAVFGADKAQHDALGQTVSGVASLPHKKVCDNAKEGEADCHARVIVDPHGRPAPAATPVGYGPKQWLNAYGLSGTASGRQIVAVITAYDNPTIAGDLTTYSKTFGIPSLSTCSGAIASSSVPCFKKVNQNGATSPLPAYNSNWALETALDVETVHAVCQNCSILLVEANSNSYYDLMAAVDRAVALGANVVSNSYGSVEFDSEWQFDSHFTAPGVAFLFSSGDAGYGPQYPAASNKVTAVGGTTLVLNSDNSYKSESAWAGAGSGCSVYQSKPTWQTDTACASRTIADVSADADPNTGAAIYMTTSAGKKATGTWYQVGGTSLATPIMAAVYALSGNYGTASTPANALPYALGNSGNLRDVTQGANGSCGGSYLCTALLGYDGPTGLGSPKGASAF